MKKMFEEYFLNRAAKFVGDATLALAVDNREINHLRKTPLSPIQNHKNHCTNMKNNAFCCKNLSFVCTRIFA